MENFICDDSVRAFVGVLKDSLYTPKYKTLKVTTKYQIITRLLVKVYSFLRLEPYILKSLIICLYPVCKAFEYAYLMLRLDFSVST